MLVGDFVRAQDSLEGANATSHSSPHLLHVEVVDDVVSVWGAEDSLENLDTGLLGSHAQSRIAAHAGHPREDRSGKPVQEE